MLPVVLFHLGVPFLPGGYAGVDVFFVLSGFLITKVIVGELETGRFSLAVFFDRRVRRLLPAFALVLSVATCASLVILLPGDLINYGRTLTASVIAASNIHFARQAGGYFAPSADQIPLLHTWSLAVEEQFYLIFPLALSLAWRLSRKHIVLLLWCSFALFLFIGAWKASTVRPSAFYLLASRAWELLLGTLLALRMIRVPTSHWQREVGSATGILFILTAVTLYDHEAGFPGMAAILPCVGAALVIWAGLDATNNATLAGRLLCARLPVFIGLVSYSLYLWHWPLIVFAKQLSSGRMTPTLQASLLAMSVALAGLTWRYVERPFRTGGRPWPRMSTRFVSAGVVLCVFALVGMTLVRTGGLPSRLDAAVLEVSAARHDFSQLRRRCHADGSARARFADSCVLGASSQPRTIVFSDSHGVELSKALGELAYARNESVRQLTASACPPFASFVVERRPECPQYVAQITETLVNGPPSTIILAAHFFGWLQEGDSQDAWKGLATTARALRKAGHTVIILGPVPPHPGGLAVPSALAQWMRFRGKPDDYRFALDQRASDLIEDQLRRIATATGSTYVSVVGRLCPDMRGCLAYRQGSVMYFDDNHLSLAGARELVVELLLPVLWRT